MKKRIMTPFDSDSAKRAVVAVGSDGGRGFVMETASRVGKHIRADRIVVTAAHCLPQLPPAHPWSYAHEKTYPDLLGPLKTSKPHITAQCIYVDPVADIAVLAEPDGQELLQQWEAFDEFIQDAGTIQLSDRDPARGLRAWLLSLDGRWQPCQVRPIGQQSERLLIAATASPIVGGMSGSPIILDDGKVVGLVSVGSEPSPGPRTEDGPQPRLAQCLPVWLFQSLNVASRQRR